MAIILGSQRFFFGSRSNQWASTRFLASDSSGRSQWGLDQVGVDPRDGFTFADVEVGSPVLSTDFLSWLPLLFLVLAGASISTHQ